jgi:hypothetical protein
MDKDDVDPAILGERPDLVAWKKRHELRRSNASVPIKNKRIYERKEKYPGDTYR